MNFFSLVAAGVTPVSIASDNQLLQTAIGFLIMIILAIIGFFVRNLYRSVSELYTLVRDLCSDFSHLKGEHDAIVHKGRHIE